MILRTSSIILDYIHCLHCRGGTPGLTVSPFTLRSMMSWAKVEYNDPEIYVTENGFSDRLGNLDDLHRIYYYKHYLNQLLRCMLSI